MWFLAFFESTLHRFALAPIVPTITAEFGLSYAVVGALTSAYFLAYAAFQLPTGVLSDRIGARRMLLALLAIISLGVLLFPLSPKFEVAFALRLVVGMGAAGIWACILKMMFAWVDGRKIALSISLISASGPLGDVVTLWAVPPLAMAFGWRLGYFGLAATAPIVLVLCWRFMRAAPGPPSAGVLPARSKLLDDLRVVLGSRRLWLLSCAQLMYFGGYIGMLAWLPTYYGRELGFGKAEASFLAGFVSLAMPVTLPLCGMAADRIARREHVYLGFIIFNIAVFALVPLFASRVGYTGMIGVSLLIGASFAGVVLPYSMLLSLVPPGVAGAATGLLNTLSYATNFFYPIVLGALVDSTGSLAPIFPFVAACSAVAGLLALRFERGTIPSEA